MIAELEEVLDFVRGQLKQAMESTNEIVFPIVQMSAAGGMGEDRGILASAPSICDIPRFSVLTNSKGMAAWAVILSVDLRGSSQRAIDLGAEKTYVTMHTYLPTMAHLVEKAGGKVVGLRGDGLFAAFGVTEVHGTDKKVTTKIAGDASKNAVTCGKAMIEAIDDAINPTLLKNDIDGGLEIRVGIDVGDVVITRIGWESASELTAYGPPVNRACKFSGGRSHSSVIVSNTVQDMYPSGKSGKVTFSSFSGGLTVQFPNDMFMLNRPTKSFHPKQAR